MNTNMNQRIIKGRTDYKVLLMSMAVGKTGQWSKFKRVFAT